MAQTLNRLKENLSPTAGPYVHICCTPNFAGIEGIYDEDLEIRTVNDDTLDERIAITGQVA